jgi:hypothetical protein
MPYPETIEYIKKQLKKQKPEKIKKHLEEAGYQPAIIDELMEKAGAPKAKQKPSGIESLFKDITIGLFILLIGGTLVWVSIGGDSEREFFSPEQNNLKLSFSKISPLKIAKNTYSTIDLTKYVKNNDNMNQLDWDYGGKICINIEIKNNQAKFTSIFLPNCPLTENIKFTITSPKGETSSDTLQIKII